MCPGRTRSAGFVAGSMAVSTVAARSAAEMPVVVRSLPSMLTQNAVSNRELLFGTISGMSSSSSRSGVIARQIKPRPYFAMKLMASGVIFSAAMVRSPSFSRSSSSATMTISPARMAAMASSIRANWFERLSGVLRVSWLRSISVPLCLPVRTLLCTMIATSVANGRRSAGRTQPPA